MDCDTFQCRLDRRSVKICIDEDEDWSVVVYDLDGRKVGQMYFRLYDEDRVLKLTNAYLDTLDRSYLRQGIGTAVLQRVKAACGMPIIAEELGGPRKDDGSYLTGDAGGWVAAMRLKGLIAPGEQWHVSDDE